METPQIEDYYAMFGVGAGADQQELSRAWRRLALRWHPDRAGPGATKIFQFLAAAYDILADPIARAAYDRRRCAAASAFSSSPSTATPRAPTQAPRPKVPAVMLSRLSGPLASLLACGIARRDEPGVVSLMFSADEVAKGGFITISLPIDVRCPECAAEKQDRACRRCDGRHTVSELFSAWLAVRPGIAEDEVLTPSVELKGTIMPVRFRVRIFRGR